VGKPTGFKQWPREGRPKRDAAERLGDWREVYLPRAEEAARQQGGRCMDCGVPFCTQGCPLGNHIPDWADLVYRGRWREAWDRLAATNDLPEMTGRLCPAPCEAACTLAINQPAVAIEDLEHDIVERAFAEGWIAPGRRREATGKRVAVIGSGPAGLAAARQLALGGHAVTIFEAADRAGGLLRYGIPDFKLEKHVLDRRLALLVAEGVELRCGVRVGVDLAWADLRAAHDAVVVCVGAGRARELAVPGVELGGVCLAMDYLERQNRVVAGDLPDAGDLDARGKHVVILGGGDTGSDCLGTALRQGAASVRQIELLPAPPIERAAGNPWPRWPLVFRTSTSHAEGGERDFAIVTTRLEGDGGKLTRLHATRVEVATEGGRAVVRPRPDQPLAFPCELLIVAIGFVGPELAALGPLSDRRDPRGNLAVDARFATGEPGVFAAGDVVRGASLIVWAISNGREAARACDAYLRGGASLLPTRGADQPFG
jgi:glutamate synthase (NADPH/NADH) small chain